MRIQINNQLFVVDLKINCKSYRKIYLLVFLTLLISTAIFILSCENIALPSISVESLTKEYSITADVNKTIGILLNDTSPLLNVSSSTKVLLFYNSFWGVPYWLMGKKTHTEFDLKNLNCPVTNCILTHNRNYLRRADFVTIHVAEPDKLDIPKTRNHNQVYVMFTLESPEFIKIFVVPKYANYTGIFNLTMTYRLDSDIVMPYGSVKDKLTGKIVAPSNAPKWKEVDVNVEFDENTMKMIRSKTITAAWFVSNCGAPSRRDKLTKKLQSHGIDIDIYGKCGTKSCSFASAECDQLMNFRYKFYFSFENSLSPDYVTEKVFMNMKDFIIPVVFNGADMSRFLPPKSYINAQDFKNVADLAAHLKFLAKNETEYMQYFWWKKYYDVQWHADVPICNVCAKAHQSVHKVYDNVFEWFMRNQRRESKIDF